MRRDANSKVLVIAERGIARISVGLRIVTRQQYAPIWMESDKHASDATQFMA